MKTLSKDNAGPGGSAASECAGCRSAALKKAGGFEKLLRVTSDSKIWPAGGEIVRCRDCGLVQKVWTPALADEIAKIYSEYDLYFQGAGNEQKIFVKGVGRPRSELLLEYFFSVIPDIDLNPAPAWLDFGCGKGHLLRTMSKCHGGWKLFGADQSEKNRRSIEGVEGVEGYIAGEIESIRGTYHVLSLSHVLEHISRPLNFLKHARSHLKTDGYLLIAVPNWLQNPFDLLVADHCLHFARSQLVRVVQEAGFEVAHIDDKVLPKELVLVARANGGARDPGSNASDTFLKKDEAILMETIGWLMSLEEWGKSRAGHAKVGLLGTAIAATWLDHVCGSSFSFFVDEDPDRAHVTYLDRKVLAPHDVPADAEVLVPLPSDVAASVCRRLNKLNGPRYLEPPDSVVRNDHGRDAIRRKE